MWRGDERLFPCLTFFSCSLNFCCSSRSSRFTMPSSGSAAATRSKSSLAPSRSPSSERHLPRRNNACETPHPPASIAPRPYVRVQSHIGVRFPAVAP